MLKKERNGAGFEQNLNKLSFPKVGIGNLQRLLFTQECRNSGCVEDPRLQASGMTPYLKDEIMNIFPGIRSGFTLIELLVVVLIIGILTAVALPQYQKVVEKSKAVQALAVLKSVYPAYEAYYLETGSYPTDIRQLNIQIPWSGTRSFIQGASAISNQDWSLAVHNGSGNSVNGVCVGRISGKYQGAGFCAWAQPFNVPNAQRGKVYCIHRKLGSYIYDTSNGDYCQNIMGAVNGRNAYSDRFSAYDLTY